MNTGQTLLTLAAMMILTQMAVRINASILQTQDVMQNSKFGVTAISLATSIIEEASKSAFDENTIDDMLVTPNGLTAHTALGRDAGETNRGLFDDFDDWHGYQITDTTLLSAHYRINCTINYIDPSNPNINLSTKSFHKKLTVSVSSPLMLDTVKITTVYSYWKFR